MRHWKQILEIVLQEGAWEFARSSGPGGQNVNKVETKAVWRWSLAHTRLTFEEQGHLAQKCSHELTQAQELVISSDRFRQREQNKKDCIEKVRALFKKRFFQSPVRKKTRPTRTSQEKRLSKKKRHSQLKALRREKLS